MYASILSNSTYGPTDHHLEMLDTSKKRLENVKAELLNMEEDIDQLVKDIQKAGAPFIDGQDK